MTTYRPQGGTVAPGSLEELGKQAARLSETAGLSLTEAAVQTLAPHKLAAEQVRRAVEACNIEAVNRKFASLSGVNRIVDIAGGPADPLQVSYSLKAAAAPRDVCIEALEYSVPPQYEKRSSFEASLVAPNLHVLQNKLAAAHDEITQRAMASEYRMELALETVKSAAYTAHLDGASLSDLYVAWEHVNPALAKVAAAQLREIPWGKVHGDLNPEHRVVQSFNDFAKIAMQHHTEQRARVNLETELSRVSSVLQGASS